jgi:hypothetical protein
VIPQIPTFQQFDKAITLKTKKMRPTISSFFFLFGLSNLTFKLETPHHNSRKSDSKIQMAQAQLLNLRKQLASSFLCINGSHFKPTIFMFVFAVCFPQWIWEIYSYQENCLFVCLFFVRIILLYIYFRLLLRNS